MSSFRSPKNSTIAFVRRSTSAFVLATILAAQTSSVATEQDAWSIGDYEFDVHEIDGTHAISIELPAQELRREFGLLSNWGGIVLDARAVRDPTIENEPIGLSFAGGRDGQNFALSIGEKTFRPKLYDWQLIPIALFADSSQTGVLTTTYAAGGPGEPIRFHPAFKDRLIGMRLLQAYFMIANPEGMSPAAEYKPAGADTPNTVVGPGENSFRSIKEREAALKKYMVGRYRWESWDDLLISEPGIPVGFGTVQDPPARGGKVRLRLVGKVETMFWSAENVDGRMKPVRIDQLSNRTAPALTSLRNLNSSAMDALDNLHHYSALFRTIKEEHPDSWSTFIADVRAAENKAELVSIRTPSSQK